MKIYEKSMQELGVYNRTDFRYTGCRWERACTTRSVLEFMPRRKYDADTFDCH